MTYFKTLLPFILAFISFAYLTKADAQTLSLGCEQNKEIDVSKNLRLLNNVWNPQAAKNFQWTQCLIDCTHAKSQKSYGWSWSWPPAGEAVYSYPSFLIGQSPWSMNKTNDRKFPLAIQGPERIAVRYDADIKSNGSYNIAAEMWLTKTHSAASNDITAEIMIWSDFTPDMIGDMNGLQKIGDITMEGKEWTLWGSKNWGDASGQSHDTWTYLAYIPKERSKTMSYDAKEFVEDAVSRGWINPANYIADLELGTELVSGAGEACFNSLSIKVD